MRYFTFFLGLFFIASCKKNSFDVTPTYSYNSEKFTKGLGLSLLNIYEYDEKKMPKKFKDSLRFDLQYSGNGRRKKRIYFFSKNEGYYWSSVALGREYKVLPIKFNKGSWYLIWSQNFTSGTFDENKHSFLIFCDSLGELKVFERTIQTNL